MNFIKAIFAVFLVLSLAVYAALFVLVNTQGREIVIEKLESQIGYAPSLASLKMIFPFGIHATGFKLKDLAVDDMKASLDIEACLHNRRMVFKRIDVDGVTVNITLDEQGIKTGFLFDRLLKSAAVTFPPVLELIPSAYAENIQRPFNIESFYLTKGRVDIHDLSHGRDLHLIGDNITLEARDIVYPELTRMNIAIKADRFTGSGWLDWARRGMDMALRVPALDYMVLDAYLPPNWQAVKTGINTAVLAVDISSKAQDNDLTLYCNLTVDSIDFKPESEMEDSGRMKTIKTILAILQGSSIKPAYNFTLHTKMDDPRIDTAQIRDNFFGMVDMPRLFINSVVNTAVKALSDTASGTTKITEETVVGALSAAVDAFKGTFDQAVDHTRSSAQAGDDTLVIPSLPENTNNTVK